MVWNAGSLSRRVTRCIYAQMRAAGRLAKRSWIPPHLVVTILGTFVVLAFVRLPAPLDFAIEDVAIIAALIGSIVIGVFYVLIRARTSSKKA